MVSMRDHYDVVVIGAGIAGLTAGALLAKKGLSVAVFEAGPHPGGYCTSFRRKGYTFDSCLDAVSGWGKDGWLRKILQRLGVDANVELVRLYPLRVDNFKGDIVPIPADMPALLDLLYGIAPNEKDGTLGLLETMEDIYRTAMVTVPDTLYTDPRLDRRPNSLSRYRRLSYRDLLDDFVKDERLRAVMSDRCAFMGLPPSKVSAVAMTVMFMTYAVGGGYRIKDGAGHLATAIAGALTGHGGELHTRSRVDEITSHGGRVTGVVTNGQSVSARNVISAIDANKTFEMVGTGQAPVDGLVPSASFFMVYLGLDKDLNMPDSMGYYPGYDIERTFQDTAVDIASPGASVEIINYTNVSPGMAPEGCSSVMLMAKAAYHYKDDWYACKSREMDRLIALASRAVPGLKDSISYAEAATPFTLERYTGNTQGAAFGWEQGIVNSRPGPVTELKGLYLAGHWTYPGGGIESVAASGMVAAEMVTADNGGPL
jgi:prolycopene isomerase